MSAPWTPATLQTSSLAPPSPPRRLTTSSSDLSARLRHEETATPGRGTDRESSGVSVRAERPSLARTTRSTRIRQALATNGDIPRGRVRVVPGGGIRRRRGQQSRPRTRHLSPAARKCSRTRRMSPAAAPECGASLASRAPGAPTAPTSNHDLRAPHRSQKRPDRARLSQLQWRGGSQPWGESARPSPVGVAHPYPSSPARSARTARCTRLRAPTRSCALRR